MARLAPLAALDFFVTFGDLLRYLRRRAGLTQRELALAVNYSDTQISRLELNQRLPDIATITARFAPALGLEHEPEVVQRLIELSATIRREDAPTPGLPPYKGLYAFDEADAQMFFGREALVAQLVSRVHGLARLQVATRFLAIVGASGSGKSSLLRAGLVPALRWHPASANWPICLITPGINPLESLAAGLLAELPAPDAAGELRRALARERHALPQPLNALAELAGAPNLVLIVDQFEELFTACRRAETRLRFVDELLSAAADPAGPAVVVIALRADFYSHCAEFPGLRAALASDQEYIGAMSFEELRQAIEEPARRGHWEFEPGLVALLLQAVKGEPGGLPLLSHALLETWLRRRGRTLSLSGYLACGGVQGAIAETAEAVIQDRLDGRQRATARHIFLRLTELGEDETVTDTRRRVALDELVSMPGEATHVREVLTLLADARLITTEKETVEVAHEALIREWPTLRRWLNEDREALRLHRHLTQAAWEWQRLGREPEAAFRGARLVQALEFRALHPDRLNALEREFLDASQALAQREEASREAQRQRELQAARRLAEAEQRRAESQTQAARRLRRSAVALSVVLSLALIAAISAGAFGARNAWLARANAAIAAENRAIASTAQSASTQAIAQQAAAETARALTLVSQATAEAERLRAERETRLATARELALAANGNLESDPELSILLALQAVAETRAHGLTVPLEVQEALHQAVQASHILATFAPPEGEIVRVAFTPSGEPRVATTGPGGSVRIWEPQSGRIVLALAAHREKVWGVYFSEDGRQLATSSADKTVAIWDAQSGQKLKTLVGHSDLVYGAVFSRDASRLVSYSADGMLKVWDAGSGDELLSRSVPGVLSLRFSADSDWLAAGGADGARVWELTTGREVLRLDQTNFTGVIEALEFSPQCGSSAGLPGSPCPGHLAVAGRDGTVQIWDVASGRHTLTFAAHTGQALAVAYSADGNRLATGGTDGVKVWDVSTDALSAARGPLLTLLGHTAEVFRVAFNTEGTRLMSAGRDGTARLWDLTASHELLAVPVHRDIIWGLSLSPDGTQLATAGRDGTAKVWRLLTALTGEPVGATLQHTLGGHTGWVNGVAFSPDGSRLATVGSDRTARIWEAASGRELLTLTGHLSDTVPFEGLLSGVVGVAFDAAGRRVATAGMDGTVRVWDASSGEPLLTLVEPSPDFPHPFLSVAFSPDGTRLAAGAASGRGPTSSAYVWQADTGELLLALPDNKLWVRGIAFSADGQRLITTSTGGTAVIWDLTTGQELVRLSGSTGRPLTAAFSPDMTLLAVAGIDGVATLWDGNTAQPLLTLSRQALPIAQVVFDRSGQFLLVAGGDGVLRAYALRVEDLVRLAEARVTRGLTLAECRKYLHLPSGC